LIGYKNSEAVINCCRPANFSKLNLKTSESVSKKFEEAIKINLKANINLYE